MKTKMKNSKYKWETWKYIYIFVPKQIGANLKFIENIIYIVFYEAVIINEVIKIWSKFIKI